MLFESDFKSHGLIFIFKIEQNRRKRRNNPRRPGNVLDLRFIILDSPINYENFINLLIQRELEALGKQKGGKLHQV